MKKVIRTAAMVAFLFITATGIAGDNTLSLETTKESKTLVFEMDSDKSTAIKLYDTDNNVIYSEKVSDKTYAKRFDLNNLADGRYFFTTEDAIKKVTYTISVDGDTVVILKKKEKAKPVFKKEDRMVYLNLLNLGKKDINIAVYDSNDRKIFSETRVNEMIVEKAFNFTKAYSDSYTVVVREGENTYYEYIIIK